MLSKLFFQVDEELAGAPDDILTWTLLGIAGVCVLAALTATPKVKASLCVWTLLP